MNTLIQLKKTTPLFLVAFVLACLGPLPKAQAVVPAPDGGYPNNNTAEGDFALFSLTTGADNTAIGLAALGLNLVGSDNTAVGTAALLNNTGSNNTATGSFALFNNIDGTRNTATGFAALFTNTTGEDNDAFGFLALQQNTDGFFNNAFGHSALNANVHGSQNNAFGDQALIHSTGNFNTAFGDDAGLNITTGESNTCLGDEAGPDFEGTGSGNVLIGAGAGDGVTSGDNIVCIGQDCTSDNVSNRAFIPNIGVFAQATSGTVDFVTVRLADGKLGHVASSRRYKEDIKPMDKASEMLYQLKPVTFRFKKDLENPSPVLDYGLIAEDVAKIDPTLAVRDGKGQIESVRYMAIYNMMLNEFLKEHRKVEQQEATIAKQQKQIEALTTGLQKVSAQLEATKPAPQVVNNP